jgi:thioredoxin reductase
VGLRGPGETLSAVVFADGGERSCGGLLVHATLHQRSELAAQLGAAASEPGPIAADAVEVDAMFRTTAPGVSAAGDVSTRAPSVAAAVAAGSMAAALLVHGLTAEPATLS